MTPKEAAWKEYDRLDKASKQTVLLDTIRQSLKEKAAEAKAVWQALEQE